MAKQVIDIGLAGNDGTGDSIRESFNKVNENFTELYAAFGEGGRISFVDLSDTPGVYQNTDGNKLVALSTAIDPTNSNEQKLRFKSLIGEGVQIQHTNDSIRIIGSAGDVFSDPTPRLRFNLNAGGQLIANLADPGTPEFTFLLNRYNDYWSPSVSADTTAIPKGYGDRTYLHKSGGDINGRMSGPLFLHDHPAPLSGQGTPRGEDDLQAVTKYYVDNTSFASTINLYVSLSGDDVQPNTPEGSEGRSWAYAYKTIGEACFRAEEIVIAATTEPGPYRQLIIATPGSSATNSTVTGTDVVNGITTLRISNNAGGPVDQYAELTAGKLVRGMTSNASAIVVQYTNNSNQAYDSIIISNIKGTFQDGEEVEFGAPVKDINITIYVESGVYEEHFPIKLPRNTSLVGDEFRRTIIRPKPGVSQSRWVDLWFYRDSVFDGITVTASGVDSEPTSLTDPTIRGYYGYHYLTDPNNINSVAKDNNNIDVFLCNDSDIIRQLAVQGHGGFFMVLDPSGQILTKSPYAQNNSSFTGSINAQRFAGGQYVDAFTGNMPAQVISKTATELVVSGLPREPQTPTSFFTDGVRTEITTYRTPGTGYEKSSQLLKLNREFIRAEGIAWLTQQSAYNTLVYKKTVWSRNIGYLVDALAFDLEFEGNFKTIETARSYFAGGVDRLTSSQKPAVAALYTQLIVIIESVVRNLLITAPGQTLVTQELVAAGQEGEVASWSGSTAKIPVLINVVRNVIQTGLTVLPSVNYPKFKLIIGTDTSIPSTVVAASTISITNYTGSTASNLITGTVADTSTYKVGQVISITGAVGTEQVKLNGTWRIDAIPTGTTFRFRIDQNIGTGATFTAGLGTTTKTNSRSVLLTAGNCSMLSADFTQMNDLTYGLVATNNGLIEAVSVFTYYNWTAYYANNGGQIRSLNGSTSHGIYGVVASGSDPLEKSNPVQLVNHQIQVATVYRPSEDEIGGEGTFSFFILPTTNIVDGYIPYDSGFVEIYHPTKGLKLYSMSGISIDTKSVGDVYRIQLTPAAVAGAATGLEESLADNQTVVIRVGQQQEWAGVENTAPAKPATSLILTGDPGTVGSTQPAYRVISYSTINALAQPLFLTKAILSMVKSGSLPIVVTTTSPHEFSTGNKVRFNKVLGMTQVNGKDFYIALGDANNQNGTTKFRIYFDRARTQAVTGDDFGDFIYNVNLLSEVTKNGDRAILETDEPYDYIPLSINPTYLGSDNPSPDTGTCGAAQGDKAIAIVPIVIADHIDRLNTGYMLVGWGGRIHRVLSYTGVNSLWAYVRLADTLEGVALANISEFVGSGLSQSIPSTGTTVLYAGLSKSYNDTALSGKGAINVRISTCRITGHDFLDIGSGGYNSSNFPNRIYGNSVAKPDQKKEVEERASGRVYYVSTDQNGFFRVGRFFTIDQGTGEVGINAGRLVLEGVAGLKFKRGVRVTEFSAESNFDAFATDEKVPTMRAIYSYLNRRLGIQDGVTPNPDTAIDSNLILGPGFLDRAGILEATGDLKLGGNKITGVANPTNDQDAATKDYVDNQRLSDANINFASTPVPANGHLLAYNSSSGKWVNGETSTTGNITASLSGKALSLSLKNGTIVNAQIAEGAGIEQSKLSLTPATTLTDALDISQADLGVAAFKDTEFNATDGFISLYYPISATGASEAIVRTDTTGAIDVSQLKINTKKILDLSGADATVVEFFTPGGWNFLDVSGTTAANTLASFRNAVDATQYRIDTKKFVDLNTGDASILEFFTPNDFNFLDAKGTNISDTQVTIFGSVDVQSLKIDTKLAIDFNATDTTKVEYYTPGGAVFMTSTGNTSANSVTTMSGTIKLNAVETTSLSSGSSSGTVSGTWTLNSGASFEATYADLAEYYEGDREYESGTVVIFGGDKEVTLTSIFGDRRVAGVVTTNPAYIMNADCPGTKVCIALQGRVPVKVAGIVRKGDILVSSAKPGFAVVNNDPKIGAIIGKAVENKTDTGEGVIVVSVGR